MPVATACGPASQRGTLPSDQDPSWPTGRGGSSCLGVGQPTFRDEVACEQASGGAAAAESPRAAPVSARHAGRGRNHVGDGCVAASPGAEAGVDPAPARSESGDPGHRGASAAPPARRRRSTAGRTVGGHSTGQGRRVRGGVHPGGPTPSGRLRVGNIGTGSRRLSARDHPGARCRNRVRPVEPLGHLQHPSSAHPERLRPRRSSSWSSMLLVSPGRSRRFGTTSWWSGRGRSSPSA